MSVIITHLTDSVTWCMLRQTRKALLTQRGTRNSGAPSYASDP